MSWFLQKKFENKLGNLLVNDYFNLYDFTSQKILKFDESFFKKIANYSELKGTENVLDLGCGTGAFSVYLKQNFKNISLTSVDGSDLMIKRLNQKIIKNKLSINTKKGFAENLPYEDNTFDIIYAIFLFSYIPPTIKPSAFKEINRVLKSDGKLVFIDIEEQHGLKKCWNVFKYISNPLFIEDGLNGDYLKLLDNAGFRNIIHHPGKHQWIDIPFIIAKK